MNVHYVNWVNYISRSHWMFSGANRSTVNELLFQQCHEQPMVSAYGHVTKLRKLCTSTTFRRLVRGKILHDHNYMPLYCMCKPDSLRSVWYGCVTSIDDIHTFFRSKAVCKRQPIVWFPGVVSWQWTFATRQWQRVNWHIVNPIQPSRR